MTSPGIELGTGYVSLVISARDLGKSIISGIRTSGVGEAIRDEIRGGADQGVSDANRRSKPIKPDVDTNGLERDIVDGTEDAGKKAGKGFRRKFETNVGGVALGSALGSLIVQGVGAAARAIGGFVRESITAASDMNETVSKAGIIFGDQAKDINKWANNSARSFGLAKSEALAYAASFGDMSRQIGFTGQASAAFSKDIVQTAADLGSFNNLETDDVLDKISAAMRGEYDSLQSIIPNINAARVETEALTASGKKNAKELTAQDKALAVQAILHKDGARAMGDFARTSGGLANQQKILDAQMQSLRERIGTALLPVVTKIVTVFNNALGPATDKITNGIGFATDAVKLFIGSFTGKGADVDIPMMNTIIDGGASARGTLDRLREVITSMPTGALAALTPTFTILKAAGPPLAAALPKIGEAFAEIGRALGGALAAVLVTVGEVFATLAHIIPILLTPVLGLVQGFLAMLPTVLGLAAGLINFITPLLTMKPLIITIVAAFAAWKAIMLGVAAFQAIMTVRTMAMTAALAAQNLILKIVRGAMLVATVAQMAWNLAMSANPIGLIIIAIAALVAGIIYFFTQTELGRQVFANVMNAIKVAVAAVVDFFQNKVWPVLVGIWGAIQTAIGAVINFFTGTVLPIFLAVFTAISNAVGFVASVIKIGVDGIVAAFTFVGKVITAIWVGYIKPIFDLFAGIIRWVAVTVFQASMIVIQKAWEILSAVFRRIYDTVIKPVINFFAKRVEEFKRAFGIVAKFLGDQWKKLAAGFKIIYDKVIKPVIDFFGRKIVQFRILFSQIVENLKRAWMILGRGLREVYNNTIKRVIDFLAARIRWARDAFGKAIDAIRRAWGRVRDTLVGVYNKKIKPIFDGFGSMIAGLKTKFDEAVTNIQTAWDKIKEVAKVPIDFVVKTVINEGLIGGFNWIADKVPGATKMDTVPWPPTGWRRGGGVWGDDHQRRGHDRIPALLDHGEHVWTRAEMQRFPGGHAAMEALRASIMRGYKEGGRVWPGTTRRLSGNYGGHSGIDIPDPMGSSIFAAGDGKITYAGWNRGYGQAIFQSLAGSLEAVYGHTSRVLVQIGDLVRAGMKIGEVGSTGRSSGPHIHFEINGAGGFGSAANRSFTQDWLNGSAQGKGEESEGGGFSLNPLEWAFAPFKALINAAIGRVSEIATSPLGKIVSGMPKMLVDALINKAKGLIGLGDSNFAPGEPGAFGPGSGNVTGAAGATARKAASILGPMFGFSGAGTYAGHDPSQARALDFMTKGKAQGDAMASYARQHARDLGVMYVIWWRKIWSQQRNSEGWRDYSGTPNPHTDHVHLSFYGRGGTTRKGLGLVGEYRPELINFGGGEEVYPDALKMLNNAAKVMHAVNIIGAGVDQGQGDIYVQNPITGEYLKAEFRTVANDEINRTVKRSRYSRV